MQSVNRAEIGMSAVQSGNKGQKLECQAVQSANKGQKLEFQAVQSGNRGKNWNVWQSILVTGGRNRVSGSVIW